MQTTAHALHTPAARIRRLGVRSAVALASAVALTFTMTPAAFAHDYTVVHTGYMPANTRLSDASPASVGLRTQPIEDARAALRRAQQVAPGATYPLIPGVVALGAHDGKVVARETSGYALLYSNATTVLPEAQRVPMRNDTIFDLASVSKLFTSIAAVQLVDEGRLDINKPVSAYLPEFGVNGKESITIRHLLTHTSGLVSWLPLWSRYPDKAARINAVMTVAPHNTPGSTYEYSDLNLITLGVIVEKLRGAPLDQVVATHLTKPLGMSDTGYNPLTWGRADIRQRIAATEWQGDTTKRGIVWGEVHDENAMSLDGVAGHAGVFSTADDLAILSQALLNGGTYGGKRILSRDAVELLITDFNEEFPGNDHGLGFELNQRWYAAGLAGPREAGHTGYTGTSLVIDFDSRTIAIELTNRVHPVRTAGGINPIRRAWAQGLALAMPVRPVKGADAWFTGTSDATTSTLTLPVSTRREATLRFDLFVDTEDTDKLYLETSSDGGQTWAPQPFTLRDRARPALVEDGAVGMSGVRRWMKAMATLPVGDIVVRWRSTTDANYVGRGIYVDAVTVNGPGTHLDTEDDPGQFTASGWVRTNA